MVLVKNLELQCQRAFLTGATAPGTGAAGAGAGASAWVEFGQSNGLHRLSNTDLAIPLATVQTGLRVRLRQ